MNAPAPETAFLPPAAALAATPPVPGARSVTRALMVLVVLAFGWAAVGELDVVAVAPGTVVPSSRVVAVQSVHLAAVQKVHVAEGDAVSAGQILIELDDTALRVELARGVDALAQHAAELARAEALLALYARPGEKELNENNSAGAVRGLIPFPAQTSRLSPDDRRRVQQTLTALLAADNTLAAEAARIVAERAAARATLVELEAAAPLVEERVEAERILARQRMAPRTQWLALEAQRRREAGEAAALRAQLGVFDKRLAEIDHRRAAQVAARRADWLDQIATAAAAVRRQQQALVRLARAIGEHQLRAPIDGHVQQLSVSTVGGVVTPGTTLLRVVPRRDGLRVRAWVANQDIGFVHVGQRVVVKVATFPFARYGVLHGRIASLSRDAVPHEALGSAFLARVELDATKLTGAAEPVQIGAGMAVSVEADLGQRRVLSFLLSPLLRYRDEALRER